MPAESDEEDRGGRPHRRTRRAGRPNEKVIAAGMVVEASLKLIDRDGLDRFSVHGVARDLGVTAPSIYYHFGNQAALLASVVRHILHEVPLHTDDDDWENVVVRASIATRRAILRHPNAAPLLLRFLPRHFQLRSYDRAAQVCPLPVQWHARAIEGVEQLTLAASLLAAASVAAHRPLSPEFDSGRYPSLSRALSVNCLTAEQRLEANLRAFMKSLRAEVVESVATIGPAA